MRSIWASSSSVKAVLPAARMLSRICSGLEAPARTLVTTPSRSTQLRAISARVCPLRAARAFSARICSRRPSVRADSFNARSHYYPFAGGKYGGSLTLEKEGKIYRIERFFDKKSEKKDECKVYCNDRLIESQNIGQELFGLNEESFERTVLFTS